MGRERQPRDHIPYALPLEVGVVSALYDDDPVRDAEEIARRWADRYVGRRRAREDGTPQRIDEHTLTLLVDARICWYLGDRDGWEDRQVEARQRLYDQGYSRADATDLIHAAEDTVVARANATVIGLAEADAGLALIGTVDQFLAATKGDDRG